DIDHAGCRRRRHCDFTEIDSVRITRLCEERLGLFRIVRVDVLETLVEPGEPLGDELPPPAGTRVQGLRDRLPVESVVERLAHPQILQWLRIAVDRDLHTDTVLDGNGDEAVTTLDCCDVAGLELADVDLTAGDGVGERLKIWDTRVFDAGGL